jgi:hypothetical protein
MRSTDTIIEGWGGGNASPDDLGDGGTVFCGKDVI